VSVAAVWARARSARGFLHLSIASLVALFLVVTSGAFVRLTGSGSGKNGRGVGCRAPEQGFHAFVEPGTGWSLVGIVLARHLARVP
jgi:hypothetical protein